MTTHVLVINPQLAFAVSLKQALERTGAFDVHPFTTPDAALDYLREHPQDVALVDLTVPGMRAEQIIHHLRDIQPGLPIVVSPRQPEDRMRALDVQGAINMPFNARDVIPLLNNATTAGPAEPQLEDDSEPDLEWQQEPDGEAWGADIPEDWQTDGPSHTAVFSTLDDVLDDVNDSQLFGDHSRDSSFSTRETKEIAQSDAGRPRQNFDDLVESMRRDVPRKPLHERTQSLIDFTLPGARDVSEDEPPPGSKETTSRLFHRLTEEEPPLPDFEESGTVGDLMSGVIDTGFRDVLAILRGEEVDDVAESAGIGASELQQVIDSFYEAEDVPAREAGARPARENDRFRDFDDGEQGEQQTEGDEDTPARRILQTALDDTTPPESFSLDSLIASIEQQLPEYRPNVQPLPSWLKDTEPMVAEPDFLPEALDAESSRSAASFDQTTRPARRQTTEQAPIGELETESVEAPPLPRVEVPELPPVDLPEQRPEALPESDLEQEWAALFEAPATTEEADTDRPADRPEFNEEAAWESLFDEPAETQPQPESAPWSAQVEMTEQTWESEEEFWQPASENAAAGFADETQETFEVWEADAAPDAGRDEAGDQAAEPPEEQTPAETEEPEPFEQAQYREVHFELSEILLEEKFAALYDEESEELDEPAGQMPLATEEVDQMEWLSEETPEAEEAASEWLAEEELEAGEDQFPEWLNQAFERDPEAAGGQAVSPTSLIEDWDEEDWPDSLQEPMIGQSTELEARAVGEAEEAEPLVMDSFEESWADPREVDLVSQEEAEPEPTAELAETFAQEEPPELVTMEWPSYDSALFDTQFDRLAAFDFPDAEEMRYQPALGAPPVDDPRVAQLALSLTQASLESTADGTVLTRHGRIIAFAGNLTHEDLEEIREAIADDWNTDVEQARVRFITLASSGKEYMLYSRHTEDDLVLSMIFGAKIPLRDIRRQSKRLMSALEAVPEPPAGPTEPLVTLVDDADSVELAPVTPAQPSVLAPYTAVWVLRDANAHLDDEVATAIAAGLTTQLQEMHWQIHDVQAQDEYVYVLADIPADKPVPEVIRDLKRRSADIARAVDTSLNGGDLWADGYLIVTPGRQLDPDEIHQFITFERM